MQIAFTTTLALLAFAGNSVLCRLALGDGTIDAASFTTVRLLSGIVVLVIIVNLTRIQPIAYSHGNNPTSDNTSSNNGKGTWRAGLMLFLYAVSFSYAYVFLDTGTGALILFGVVQITMIIARLLQGKQLHYSEWLGIIIAFAGLVYLMLPDISTPSLTGFILMAISGVAWGLYTLAGKGSQNPLFDTTGNFVRTLPWVIILTMFTLHNASLTTTGVILAILSGSVASGLGYTVWYIALRGISSIQAAVLQLFVPVIAAVGGILFANELLSMRLIIASVMILGGIVIVVGGEHYVAKKNL